MLDFARCRLTPFEHQKEDTETVVDHPYFFIASEMRTGKTKIIIDAAQFLYEAGIIDRMLVIAPAPVRDVWFDKDLGELAKHLWLGLPARVIEYHVKFRDWTWPRLDDSTRAPLQIIVTNYEWIRGKSRLTELMPFCTPKTMIVFDESSFIKNHAAAQTKACLQLRRACGRAYLLNGTPLFHSPLDLFSQGNILHRTVLDCQYVTHFRARYSIQEPVLGRGGKALTKVVGKKEIVIQQTVGWTNLDDLQRRFAPVTVRRLQKDCLDLPPKLDPVPLTATLTPETWKAYKAMRDDLVVWLSNNKVAISATAAVKALRLSQITNGFLGGVEDAIPETTIDNDLLSSLSLGDYLTVVEGGETLPEGEIIEPELFEGVQAVGREKLDILLWFIEQRLQADPNLHLVAWCRYRAEVLRALAEVTAKYPHFETGAILGGQRKSERLRSLALLKPETSPVGPVFIAGIEGTGSFGLDMTASHTCVTMSSGYSPGRSAQTLDRVYGPGQKEPIAYFDIIAVGPRGQKTIDHDIIVARRTGEDVAARTAAHWVKVLTEE